MLSVYVDENISIFKNYLKEQDEAAENAADKIIERLEAGNKVMTMGNGGSAGHAADFASELANRFSKTWRKRLAAICLVSNDMQFSAIANDSGYENVFADHLEALGKKGDVLVGFSTSGTSHNIVRAFQKAKEMGLFTLGFAGRPGNRMAEFCDICLFVPHDDTDVIQNGHSILYHYICRQIDNFYLGKMK